MMIYSMIQIKFMINFQWITQFLTGREASHCSPNQGNGQDSEQAAAIQRKNAAKAGYLETRRQKKIQEHQKMNREQSQLISHHLPELQELLKESSQDYKERRVERQKLRAAYDEHVALRKYKHNVSKRLEQAQQNIIQVELNRFASEVLWRRTDDEVVYQYQRKLQKQMQYSLMWKQWIPILMGLGLYKLTRRLKKASPTDIGYFVVPYLYQNYGMYLIEQKSLFEMGYPAHPYVIEQRMKMINKTCFAYPAIVKNEIEYIHTKLSDQHKQRQQDQQKEDAETEPLKFEQIFTVGQVTSDYKRLLKSQAKQEVKESKEEENQKLLKFKIIVEDGELFLQCIDPFEEIFEISKDAIENLELTELLDPYMFESHRDIINALFEVYYSLSQDYLKVFLYDKQKDLESSSLQDRATQKLRQKYNLDDELGQPDAEEQEKANKVKKTIQEASKKV